MITIDTERCTGCGACVEVCPTGALYLVDGKAMVDETRCRECEACLAACPTGAITITEQEQPMSEAARLPALRPQPAVIKVQRQPAPVPFRSRVLRVLGAALTWAGREILPSLAEFVLTALDRRASQPQAVGPARRREAAAYGGRGRGRQHRHRRRGGGA